MRDRGIEGRGLRKKEVPPPSLKALEHGEQGMSKLWSTIPLRD